jgi:hypothetical protein
MHIFFHIPKAAGTNFANKLIAATGSINPLKIVRPIDLAFMSDLLINEKDIICGHFGWAFLNRIKGERKTYTILRDPVSRIVSQYKYMVKLTQEGMLKKSAMINFIKKNNRSNASSDGLKEILQDKEIPYIEGAFRNTATWTFVSDSNVSSRWESDDKAILEIAKEHLSSIDFIGLVEEMDATFELLSSYLGEPIENDVRENNSDDINFAVDDELIELINENNRLDICLYSWARQIFHDRYSGLLGKIHVLVPNNFSGSGWLNGVRTEGESNTFYFLAPSTSELNISIGAVVEFAATGRARVVRINPSQQNGVLSVFVTVDRSIDPIGDGFPNRVFVQSKVL